MADDAMESPKKTIKKKGLPPISPRNIEDTESHPKPTKKKVRRKPFDENTPPDGDLDTKEKPAPRRRRKRSPSQTKAGGEGVEEPKPVTDAAPKKKKKKPRAPVSEQDGNQNADTSREKEGQGSKTSLISKDGATPRKKVVKKKKKVKKETAEDEFGESPWSEDLKTMEEDIISGEVGVEGGGEQDQQTVGTEKPIEPELTSKALPKIFIETSSRFKVQSKDGLARQRHLEETLRAAAALTPAQPLPRATTIDFAVASHSVFRVLSLFLHGLTAGLLLWQMVVVFVLSSSTFSNADFLEHYRRLSMPLQASLYCLIAIGTVSACDRFDIGNPTRRFLLRAFTMQNGAIAILFSVIALIISLVLIKYDDKMYLYADNPQLYADPSELSDDISTFRSLNAARSVLVVLCWLVLSLTPTCDRLGENLKSGETGLEFNHEMDKVSAA